MKKDFKEALQNIDKKTLYVSRPVANTGDIIAWAKKQGFKDIVSPENMHVTLAYSSAPVDWALISENPAQMEVKGGKRSVEPLGDKGAVVLKFESIPLLKRWRQIRHAGASWDFDGFMPHISITYNGDGMDVSKVIPYDGVIYLRGEDMKALDEDWVDKNEKSDEKPPVKEKVGYDFDGVADHLEILPDGIIITGRNKDEEAEVREKVGDREIYFNPNKDYSDKAVGAFKSEMIKKLGITKFHEDRKRIVEIIKRDNPNVEVIHINPEGASFEEVLRQSEETSLDYDEESPLNMVWFTFDGIGLPIAKKLIAEGNNVIIAQIQSKKDLNEDDNEEPEVKRRRLSLYDGILDKQDAAKVLRQMKNVKDKDKWIVFFDFNSMGFMAEKVLAMGYKRGLFPLLKDCELEKDRDAAKDIVKKHYPDLTVAEVNEFSKAADGIKFLEETEQLWVLKGNGDSAKTLVPQNDDPELAKRILIDALEAHTKNYEEDGGFILEEKIVDGYEATPQIVFLDGKVVFTDVDIENKNVGAGNLSVQTGAMQTLVVKSKLKDKINDIAFPDWVYKRAKEHTGLFITDAGLICKDGKYYFTEFCFQRFGYDSFFAEIDMAGTATDFFSKLFKGENPLVQDFGVAIRGMNMHKGDKDRRVLEGVSMTTGDADHTYMFECKAEDDKYVSTGGGWDLVVFAGSGVSINAAAEIAYKAADDFAFEDLYYRPKFDFLSFDYISSIPNRFSHLNGKLFIARLMENMDKYMMKIRMKELEDSVNEALHEQEEA